MDIEKNIQHVAIYLRISEEKKNENVDTLANHRDMLVDIVISKGWTYEIFGEVLSGGKSELTHRPELMRLLDSIEKFDALVCMEISRLSRNGLISQTVKQYCIDYDKPIVTPYQTYDLSNNSNDRLMFDFGSVIASQEHSLIGKRSKSNKIQMAKSGLHISGNVPFGYRRNNDTKKLEIDEEAAKTIRYIFHLHSKGLGSFRIRDILNEEGYKSATGKYFNLPAIKRIIRNPAYKGWTVFNDRKKIKKNGKFVYENVNSIVVKDAHPPIISEFEWNLANKDREMRADKSAKIREKPVVKSEVTLLKDLIYCDKCGRKMTIRRDSKSSMGYTLKKCEYTLEDGSKCNNSGIKIEFLEEDLLEELETKRNVHLLEKIDQWKNGDLTSSIKQLEEKRSQFIEIIEDISRQEEKLIDLALSGIFTNEQIKEKKFDLENRKQSIRQKVVEIEQELSSIPVEEMIELAEEQVKTISNLREINPIDANASLKTFIKKIYYSREIPPELLKKSTRNEERKYYPFSLKVEYYE